MISYFILNSSLLRKSLIKENISTQIQKIPIKQMFLALEDQS